MLGPISTFRRRLIAWFDRNRRDLPWRLAGPSGRPDPYHVLVSEAMLQQTQVAAVIPYFTRFIARFPTVHSLADAQTQEVLRMWQGLGYYSRARNLHAAARRVVEAHAGQLPRDLEQLLALPGVGRYTAGAIASLAYDLPAPILDGNVMRVLARLDQIETDPRERTTNANLWRRAQELVPARRAGDFNSAMMELGAMVCIPRRPQCLICPVRRCCEAQANGVELNIPAPRKARPTPLVRRRVFCIERDGKWLIEQRPPAGRWAGLWQFITVDDEGPPPAPPLVLLGEIRHALTHRRYVFEVYRAAPGAAPPEKLPRAWASLAELDAYPLSRPQLRIRQLLGETGPQR